MNEYGRVLSCLGVPFSRGIDPKFAGLGKFTGVPLKPTSLLYLPKYSVLICLICDVPVKVGEQLTCKVLSCIRRETKHQSADQTCGP